MARANKWPKQGPDTQKKTIHISCTCCIPIVPYVSYRKNNGMCGDFSSVSSQMLVVQLRLPEFVFVFF
jgi:hypothetical protein